MVKQKIAQPQDLRRRQRLGVEWFAGDVAFIAADGLLINWPGA